MYTWLCHLGLVDLEIKCALGYSPVFKPFHIIALPSGESSNKRWLELELRLMVESGSARQQQESVRQVTSPH